MIYIISSNTISSLTTTLWPTLKMTIRQCSISLVALMFYGIKDYLTENRWYLHILLNLSAQVTWARVNRGQTGRTSSKSQ